MNNIAHIENQTQIWREKLTHHELYHHLSDVDDIQIFMEKHVFAVWDFMSLLKALQHHLTCTTLPWKPVRRAKTARFINEIVWGEESDVNEKGIPKSHFEMYLDAMKEVGANTDRIEQLVSSVNSMDDILEKLSEANLQKAEYEFLEFTFNVIRTGEVHKIAAAFTFGREDLIPDMFIEIIENGNNGQGNQLPKLSYYLNRHIELDGDEHGPLSLEMITELCGDDPKKWNDALEVSIAALRKRLQLWDEITEEIKTAKPVLGLV